MRCSVVIADAQRLVCESLRAMVESQEGLEVVGAAEDGRALVDLCVEKAPDVLVVDAQLPRLSGIEAIQRINRRGVRSQSVVTSDSRCPGLVRAALVAGASGFVPKTAPAGELLDAIRAAHLGQPFFLRSVEGSLAEVLGTRADPDSSARLSGRQTEVLQLIAEGLSTKEIAGQLGVSVKTAQTHRTNLMKKVGAHKASELVRYAIRAGIVRA